MRVCEKPNGRMHAANRICCHSAVRLFVACQIQVSLPSGEVFCDTLTFDYFIWHLMFAFNSTRGREEEWRKTVDDEDLHENERNE